LQSESFKFSIGRQLKLLLIKHNNAHRSALLVFALAIQPVATAQAQHPDLVASGFSSFV